MFKSISIYNQKAMNLLVTYAYNGMIWSKSQTQIPHSEKKGESG